MKGKYILFGKKKLLVVFSGSKLNVERNSWNWSFIGLASRNGIVPVFLGGCNITREMYLSFWGLQ